MKKKLITKLTTELLALGFGEGSALLKILFSKFRFCHRSSAR